MKILVCVVLAFAMAGCDEDLTPQEARCSDIRESLCGRAASCGLDYENCLTAWQDFRCEEVIRPDEEHTDFYITEVIPALSCANVTGLISLQASEEN